MGKNLKGKSLGKGISQRKDGRYSARLVYQNGERKEKYFKTLSEAKDWLAGERYQMQNTELDLVPFEPFAEAAANDEQMPLSLSCLTVDEWFAFWIKYIIPHLSYNTKRNYRERYTTNVSPVIGKMKLTDVRPMHCRKILTDMDEDYAGSTIKQTYVTMGTLFKAAKMNGLIKTHPMDGVRFTKPVRSASDIKFLTQEEQDIFLENAKTTHNYNAVAFVLETGLRTGELVGLTWDDVDFDEKTITINKTLEYRYNRGTWLAGPPKTASGYRTIPLTDKAYAILMDIYKIKDTRKGSSNLGMTLKYMDRFSGEVKTMVMEDVVFRNFRTGFPTKNSAYDTFLVRLCDKSGIKRVSMHALRHTYATRAIERGVQPKVLQELLGHNSITTTMNRYVHVTNDSKKLAVAQFEGKTLENGVNGVEKVTFVRGKSMKMA